MINTVSTISQKQFNASFLSDFRAVFTGRGVGEVPFVDDTWEMMLLAYGMDIIESDFNSIVEAALAVQDREVLITGVESLPPHQDNYLLPFTREAWEEVRCDSVLGHIECAVFGSSNKWGVICSPVNDFCCVAGDKDFMNVFVSSAGGREAVKERFIRFASEEWEVDVAYKDALILAVGWA